VRTRPCRLRTPKGVVVYVVPLLSWYNASWDTEPDLPPEVLEELYGGRAGFKERWADFRLCKWPESIVAKEVRAGILACVHECVCAGGRPCLLACLHQCVMCPCVTDCIRQRHEARLFGWGVPPPWGCI
jgi:hypothetical protein